MSRITRTRDAGRTSSIEHASLFFLAAFALALDEAPRRREDLAREARAGGDVRRRPEDRQQDGPAVDLLLVGDERALKRAVDVDEVRVRPTRRALVAHLEDRTAQRRLGVEDVHRRDLHRPELDEERLRLRADDAVVRLAHAPQDHAH